MKLKCTGWLLLIGFVLANDWQLGASQPRNITIPGVPFVSQLSASCSPNYLCQYACAAMVAGKSWGASWATTSVMQDLALTAKGRRCPQGLSNCTDAANALNTLGRTTHAASKVGNFDSIKNEIANGHPVSISVKYSVLGDLRFDRHWDKGHQLVVIGFSETNQTWTYLDPLARNNGQVTVSSGTFHSAVTSLPEQAGGYFWYLVAN